MHCASRPAGRFLYGRRSLFHSADKATAMPGLARICARTTATRRFGTSLPRQALLSSLFGRAGNTKAENNGASDTRIQDAPRDASSFTAPLELAQKSRHRPPTLEECKFVRKVGDGSHPLPEENPGARVHLNLLSVSELESLEGASRDLCRTYGIDLIDPLARAAYMVSCFFVASQSSGSVSCEVRS